MLGSDDSQVNTGRRRPWIGIGVVIALAAGIAVAVQQSNRVVPRAPAPVDLSATDSSEDLIEQAMGQIPVDSTELRNRWLDEIPGLDVTALTLPQRTLLVRIANSTRCSCGCGFTLATCRAYDTTCPVSGPRVEAMRDSVAAGLLRERPGLRSGPG